VRTEASADAACGSVARRFLAQAAGPSVRIWFWCNVLMLVRKGAGVPGAVRAAAVLARAFPLAGGGLEETSARLDRLLERHPRLFLRRRKRCLVRGVFLYFQGKRMRMDVVLRFGCRAEQGRFLSHCWLVQDGRVRCEDPDGVRDFVLLQEFR